MATRLRQSALVLALAAFQAHPAQAIYIGTEACRDFTPRGKESQQTLPLCSDLEAKKLHDEEERSKKADDAARLQSQREEADRNALRADLPFPPSAFDVATCRREMRLNPTIHSVCP